MISGPLGPTRQPLATPRPHPKLKSKWGVSKTLRSRVFKGGGGVQGLKNRQKIESEIHSDTFRHKIIEYVIGTYFSSLNRLVAEPQTVT